MLALAKNDKADRPILYVHYIDDPDYVPDPDLEPDEVEGRRPLRFYYNPSYSVFRPAATRRRRLCQRGGFARWMPRFMQEYKKHEGAIYLACAAAGTSEETIRRFRMCSPDFDRWLTELKGRTIDEVEASLIRQAKSDKNTLATLAYLNANRSELYKRPNEVRVTGPEGGAVQVAHTHTIHIMIPDNGRGDRLALEGEYTELPALEDMGELGSGDDGTTE